MKTITINGEQFKVVKSTTKEGIAIIQDIRISEHNDLFDIYGNPSSIKRDIWRGWCEWVKGIESGSVWCLRGSSHAFSIGGKCEIEGKEGYLYITKSYNKIVI